MGRYETHPHIEAGVGYCRDVLSGAIPACKWTKAACQRHIDDLDRWSTSDAPYCFDADEAERVCRFIELLPHIKGEWARRNERIRLEPWQSFIVVSLFGWRKPNGKRRFQTGYIEVARKNAKSTFAAAIALLLLAADGEAGAEVYSLATTRQQAGIVFRIARQMALREPGFREAYDVQVNAHNVSIIDEEAKMEAQSAEDSTLDGLNVHGAIVDEFHAHKTRGVWDVIETATGARQQSLVLAITTSGTNRAGICYEIRGYLCDILNTVLRAHEGVGYRIDGNAIEDESFFGVVYTIDDGDNWTDERVWVKANPNFGISVNPDDLRRKARKAMQRASAQPNFLTKHLDVWVNADSAWMDMLAWEKCADRKMRADDFRGWRAVIGLDIASKIDICSQVLLMTNGSGEYRLFGRHYLPEDTIEDSDNSQYRSWADQDYITETEGAGIDPQAVETDLKEWVSAYGARVAFDPGYGWDFCYRMTNDGLPMIEYPSMPVTNFSEPMKMLEELVIKGAKDGKTFKHDGNPAMTWMISNVVCHRDPRDNIYPRKERVENKIDGPVATIMALGLLLRDKPVQSAYANASEIVI